MKYQIFSLLIFSAFVLNCQDPYGRIDFKVGNKVKKEYKVDLIDGKLDLRVFGGGGATSFNQYALGLSVRAEYPELKGELQFDPQQITVIFKNQPLRKSEHYIDERYHIVGDDYYYVSVSFYEPLDSLISNTSNHADSTLKIILDGFITYYGQPVGVDTIIAFEPRLRSGYLRRN